MVKWLLCLQKIDQKQNCITTSEQYYYIDLSGQFVTQFRKTMMPPLVNQKVLFHHEIAAAPYYLGISTDELVEILFSHLEILLHMKDAVLMNRVHVIAKTDLLCRVIKVYFLDDLRKTKHY